MIRESRWGLNLTPLPDVPFAEWALCALFSKPLDGALFTNIVPAALYPGPVHLSGTTQGTVPPANNTFKYKVSFRDGNSHRFPKILRYPLKVIHIHT